MSSLILKRTRFNYRWPTHGYEATREAAMVAFAKSWRRGNRLACREGPLAWRTSSTPMKNWHRNWHRTGQHRAGLGSTMAQNACPKTG
jgi:hypothetical protein